MSWGPPSGGGEVRQRAEEKRSCLARDWETLYCKYFPKLKGYFASQGLRPADTEDLTQEVFQKLARSKVPEDPKAYLYTIARHILSQHRRHRTRRTDRFRGVLPACDNGERAFRLPCPRRRTGKRNLGCRD